MTRDTFSDNGRIAYLDLIRIIACFLVVMVHISACQLESLPIGNIQFIITNTFSCLAFAGVALFVMISGALALNPRKETRLKNLLINKTLHFFILYYIWKAFYQIIDMLEKEVRFTPLNIKNDIVLALIQKNGYYHLWFLPMIAIVYMAVPIIKKGFAEKSICEYYLCVFSITTILFPTLFNYEFKFKYLLVDFFAANDFYLFGGYLGYFVLGHYLHNWGRAFTKKMRIVLYAAGCISFLSAGILGTLHAQAAGHHTYSMNTPFAVTNFLIAAAIFVKIQDMGRSLDHFLKARKVLAFCAGKTFGIYLLHPLAIELLRLLGFIPALYTPLLSVPLLTIVTVLICMPVTVLLSKIPVLRRLIQ